MKKILLAALLVAAFAMPAKADLAVEEMARSSVTVNVVAISNAAGTQVDAAAILMAKRKVLEIQNLHATAILWCSGNANVTVSNGRMIVANGGTWVLNLAANRISSTGTAERLTIYCINDSGGSTNASVTQAY